MPGRRGVAVILSVSVVASLFSFALGFFVGRYQEQKRGEWVEGRLISSAIESVRANALDTLSGDELIKRAVSGMLRELQDPYAAMLRSDGLDRYRGTLQGDGRGLGLTVRQLGGTAIVTRVVSGSPAWTRGIRRGDRILRVNGEPYESLAEKRDNASDSDTVLFTIQRASYSDTLGIAVPRGEWHQPAVREAGFVADTIGYVHLTSVSARAADELEESVAALIADGARVLVLDLRGNSGGLLEEGVRVASLFLPRGATVASVSGRSPNENTVHYARGSRFVRLPLTVLVDGQTASSAELVAAALRDNGRAQLVGTRTYGKGYVQRVVRLSPDVALRLTTARWLTPLGQQVSRDAVNGHTAEHGLVPDVVVTDSAQYDALAVPRGWDTPRIAGALAKADTIAVEAIRGRWPATSTQELEETIRAHVVSATQPRRRQTAADSAAVETVVRLALVRVLETYGDGNALLRYRARGDGALRAALEQLAPNE